MELKRVVVTGMGALTPLGNNVPDYWNGLINGVSGADMITQFDASKFRTKFACEIKNFEPTDFLDRISAIRDLSESMGIHLVINARTDAFLTSSGTADNRLLESIKRGNIYKDAGADCIFVPNVTDVDSISALVKDIAAPVNILANPTNGTALPPTLKELEDLGVARLSVGSSLMKSTPALIKRVADETIHTGTYNNLFQASNPIEETVKAYKMATDNPQN